MREALLAPQEEKTNVKITMMKRSTTPFGHSLGRTTGWVHRAELARHGVRMLKGVEYRRIDGAGVHISVEGKEIVVPADTVIVCAGHICAIIRRYCSRGRPTGERCHSTRKRK